MKAGERLQGADPTADHGLDPTVPKPQLQALTTGQQNLPPNCCCHLISVKLNWGLISMQL